MLQMEEQQQQQKKAGNSHFSLIKHIVSLSNCVYGFSSSMEAWNDAPRCLELLLVRGQFYTAALTHAGWLGELSANLFVWFWGHS